MEKGVLPLLQVKLFDYEHEYDLEIAMNQFLAQFEEDAIVKINYDVTALESSDSEQIYCFGAMVIYRE